MVKALDVAKYIVNALTVDNLKLQKLLYYCQAVYLVKHDEPMFSDKIEAWQYGPVIPGVYHKFKKYGLDNIDSQPDSALPLEAIEVADMVLEYYGSMTSIALVNKTHSEAPWKSVYKPNVPNIEITTDSMKKFYSKTISFN